VPASGARGLSGVAGCVKDTEPEPKWAHHTDRASDRDEDDREQHFQDWLARYGKPYSDAVEPTAGSRGPRLTIKSFVVHAPLHLASATSWHTYKHA